MSNYKVNGVDLDTFLVKHSDIDWDIDGGSGSIDFAGGKLFMYGQNDLGQLGVGDVVNKSSPTQVGADVKWISAYHATNMTIAQKSDFTLWTWGDNSQGQLGSGTITSRSSPVQVGTLAWGRIAATSSYVVATRFTGGTLWSWGNNATGQLGSGTIASRSSPVQIGTLTNWHMPKASGQMVLATKTDGTLWGWGLNTIGILSGLADTNPRSSPVQIGTVRDWDEIVACNHTYWDAFLKKFDGSIWAIGANTTGSFGLGNTNQYTDFVKILDAGWRWFDASTHSVYIKADGTMWASGLNTNGQLGVGDTTNRSSFVQIGASNDWYRCYINRHGTSTFAIKTNGTLWAWGLNDLGQLGLGDTVSRSSPVQVGTSTNWLTPYIQIP